MTKVDRFARKSEDHFYVRSLLRSYGTTLHSVTEPIGDDPTGKLLETVLAGTAEFDNAIRTQRVLDGMAAKLSEGIYPWKAPVGYKCLYFKKRDEKKTAPDPPDEEIFPIIQRGLKEYARGTIHSLAELARLLDSWDLGKARGRHTTKQFVDRLLGKYLKFYAGILVNPWTHEELPGLHEAMITKDEFYRIQLIRSGKSRVMKRDKHNPTFPLRRTVLCATCTRPFTGSVSQGNGGHYAYYHCANSKCASYGKSIRKSELEDAFDSHLHKIALQDRFVRVFKEAVLKHWQEGQKKAEQETRRFRKQIASLTERRKRICEMREDGSYTLEVFQERLADVDSKIAQAKLSSSETQTEDTDLEALVSYTLRVAEESVTHWRDVPPEHLQARFQKLVFPKGVPYERNRGIGTVDLGLLFELNRQFGDDKSQVVGYVRQHWNQIVRHLKEIQALAASQDQVEAAP